MPTTARADLVAGFSTMMAAFISANPTAVLEHLDHRPPNLTRPTPFTYLDLRPEEVSHGNSLRTRLMRPSLVYVDQWTEAGEVMGRLDANTDLLVDHLTDTPHIVAGTIWSEFTISDEEIDGHPVVRFTFGNYEAVEPRV